MHTREEERTQAAPLKLLGRNLAGRYMGSLSRFRGTSELRLLRALLSACPSVVSSLIFLSTYSYTSLKQRSRILSVDRIRLTESAEIWTISNMADEIVSGWEICLLRYFLQLRRLIILIPLS